MSLTFGTTVNMNRETFIRDKNDMPGAILYTCIKNDLAETKTKAFLEEKDDLTLNFKRVKTERFDKVEISVEDGSNRGRWKTFDDISIAASTWVEPVMKWITDIRAAAKTPPPKA